MTRGRTFFAVLMVAIMAISMAAPALAATSDDPVTDHLTLGDWDEEETAPHPVTNVSVTTAGQDLSQGTNDEAIMGYEDDNGDWVAGADNPFVYNDTHDEDDNPGNDYTFNPAHINDAGLQEFPDGHDADDDWLNSSADVWEVTDDGDGNVTVSETTVASDVDAIRFDTGSNADSSTDGDIVFDAAYNQTGSEDGSGNINIDSDESKRVLLVGGDLDTLDTEAELQIRVYDESGSYKEIRANDSENIDSGPGVFANSTGSFFYQIKLNALSTQGADSDFDNIENVTVRTVSTGSGDADVDVSVSALDLRRKAKLTLGEKRATTNDDGNDPDDDDDYDEFQTIYNATGDISVHSMDTLDSEFDDATVNDLTYPAHFEAAGLDEQGEDGEYAFYWEEPDDPQYDHKLNVTYSLELPSAIDLSYSNTEVRMTQKWSDGRYSTLEQASEVADSTNLSDASYSSVTTSSKGDTLSIQSSSVDAGERFLVHYELQLTDEERNDMVEAQATGGAAAPPSEGAGFWSDPVNWLWGGVISIVGFLGLRRFGVIGGG